MTPNEIKMEIYRRRLERKLTMTMIARSIGVSKQAISMIIERRQTSRRIAQAVADAIERPLVEVFPEFSENEQRDQAQAAACN